MKLIYKKEEKQRLDKYLVEELSDFSRSQIQKLIKEKEVTVNDKHETAHFALRENDNVEVNIAKGFAKLSCEVKKVIPKPEVITETDDYLILNKPAHLIIHPAPSIKEPTLVDWLKNNYPDIKDVGEDEIRPGIVQRLDKEVSGVMVIAKTQKMFEHLKNEFQERNVKKEYLALVYGVLETETGIIDFPLKRSKLTGRMVALPKHETGKKSITKYVVETKYSRYTYLKVTIETGRTHQIRSHLKAFNHPVVGDKIYYNKNLVNNLKLDRLFLHAHTLGFNDLNNEYKEYKIEIPKELNNILNELK